MFQMNRRNVLLGGAAILIIVLVVMASGTPPVPADFAEITRGPLRVTVDDEGQTRMKDVYVISAEVSGRLLRIETEVGDWVDANSTVLASLLPVSPELLDQRSRGQAEADLRSADANVAVAEADMRRAQAEFDFADAEVQRAKPLAERGTISRSALDVKVREAATKRAALETTRAAVTASLAARESAAARLIDPSTLSIDSLPDDCCITITSPVSGWVLRRMQESEAVIVSGTPILDIGDPTTIEIVADLLSSDAVKVREGAAVIIDGWGGDHPLAGTVQRVEPYGFTKISALGIDEQRVNVIIDLTGDSASWDRLGHGYRVDVHIDIWSGANVLKVPVSALFRASNEWAVFVVDAGVAQTRAIEIGMMNNDEAEVLSGLAEAEVVVVHPGDRVDDGVSIEERDS